MSDPVIAVEDLSKRYVLGQAKAKGDLELERRQSTEREAAARAEAQNAAETAAAEKLGLKSVELGDRKLWPLLKKLGLTCAIR